MQLSMATTIGVNGRTIPETPELLEEFDTKTSEGKVKTPSELSFGGATFVIVTTTLSSSNITTSYKVILYRQRRSEAA